MTSGLRSKSTHVDQPDGGGDNADELSPVYNKCPATARRIQTLEQVGDRPASLTSAVGSGEQPISRYPLTSPSDAGTR